ncbi:glutamate racemase [Zavarzinia compransoris]|uniref:Glutamate racemase n=1 Tax=Zavarzinia compransoris TaxID=1264899 RepID=A0A317EEK1_9PROT|nr:glutamate racemase [Zavarzinia compransoris]PWR23793.1 glutamate racemase [Zavarzinia compransoris]TDP48025.1 glutamate racemase [Zavarzinia compransoris]
MTDHLRALPIGIFDSGIGGLTVLDAIADRLPAEDLLYLGDTARLPYGTKSPETVARYAVQAAQHLVDRGVKMLVIACNTASAHAIPALSAAFPGVDVISVIEPGAAAAVAAAPSGRIGVLATESTVGSGAYVKAIKALAPDADIRQQACSVFVAMAEEGWTAGAAVEAAAHRYLEPILNHGRPKPEALVLGCTHFPLLRPAIAAVAGPEVTLVDSASTAAEAVAGALAAHGLAAGGRRGRVQFMATDSASRFARVATIFLDRPVKPEDVEIVDL